MKTAAIQTFKSALNEIESQISVDADKLRRRVLRNEDTSEVKNDIVILNETLKVLKKIEKKFNIK